MPDIRVTWFGDDFTGSTDAMEALTLSGVPAVLFLDVPSQQDLDAWPGIQAVGVAGNTRALDPAGMKRQLRPALQGLKALHAPICHYKVCSTFDSSPEIGSIGQAIEIGLDVFGSSYVPVVVGAPVLGRYTVFGNLFARSGRESEIFRLDRHPTMRHHPITPMDESDLRLHLARQTERNIALFDILDLRSADAASRLNDLLIADNADVVVFDVLEDSDLARLGNLIEQTASIDQPLYAAGSSGIEYALTAHWQSTGTLPSAVTLPQPEPVRQTVVVSGSCSPVSARQISHAVDYGFVEVPLKPDRLFDDTQRGIEVERALSKARIPLSNGQSVVLHTCLGPEDRRIADASAQLAGMGWSALDIRLRSGEILGSALGRLLRDLLAITPVDRVVVAGGDTSYHVARALGIRSLQMVAPTAPGSPLCLAAAPGSPIDGKEITFKGGQVGSIDFLEGVRAGTLEHS